MTTSGVALGELSARIGARLIGDPDARVVAVRSLDDAGGEHLSLVAHAREARRASSSRAGALLLSTDMAADRAHEMPCAVLAADDPYRALLGALALLHPSPERGAGVDPRAVVHAGARLGAAVAIGPLAVVGRALIGRGSRVGALAFVDDDVELGEECDVGPGAVLMRGARLGDRVQLQPGAVIGADGFGYAPDGSRNVKVPQVGGVRLGDDVEIGANSCVDRGALSDTRVMRGTKIDNLVQIAHGAVVGEDVVIVAQSGLAGGARVGDRVVLGGQAAVTPFVTVGDDARIGARAGVTRDVPARAAWSGVPAYPHAEWLRSSIRMRDLDGMFRRLKQAEERIAALEARLREAEAGDDDDVRRR